ncbi:MAG: hypothetical protein ACRDXB_00690, partial [Actinomycetes bacterium]
GDPATFRGGLTTPVLEAPARQVTLLQRKSTPIGIGLGKTSGWAHRAHLKQDGVKQVRGATYDKIEAGEDSLTLHYAVDGEPRALEVDHVVLCAGQDSVRGLWPDGDADEHGANKQGANKQGSYKLGSYKNWHLIGGADVAAELDAKRAIKQGTEVAAGL